MQELPDRSTLEVQEGDQFSLWSYANVLLRWRYLVLALPLATGLFAGLLSFTSPRLFTASASFVAQEPTSTQSGLNLLAVQFGFAVPGSASSPQFYADLVRSREILREVVTTAYSTSGTVPFTGNLLRYFGIRLNERDEAISAALEELRGILTVETNRSTGVVNFEVSTRIPELSAQIVSRFLELVNEYNLQRRQSQARAEREFVEQRLQQTEGALTVAEGTLSNFYQHNRSFADSPELVAEEARLQRQVSLRQQLYLTLAQRFEAVKIEEVRNTPVITVLQRPEGFVEPKARRTIRKAIIAFFGGGLLAFVIAFSGEYVARARQSGSRDYEESVTLMREMIADVRRWLRRRAAK